MDSWRMCSKNSPSIIPPVRVGGLRAQPFNESRDCAKNEVSVFKNQYPVFDILRKQRRKFASSPFIRQKIQSLSSITYSISLRNKWIQGLPERASRRTPPPPFHIFLAIGGAIVLLLVRQWTPTRKLISYML
ncbi:hypothetical protein CEXT_160991 [Caerostris extrusa]|uniref:Uncharacterized protein n=1 Tax=Caerostris extrusa TaxID=172846 RepID=A0AAV4WCX7_CAEEX|nr:hypothetical protein CEXT_160991 [Caerostris extrusa]